MRQTYHLDGMVVRDQDNQYVCEITAYETDSLNNLLRAPEVLALVQVDRDIKAANLQLLVGAVAAAEALEAAEFFEKAAMARAAIAKAKGESA